MTVGQRKPPVSVTMTQARWLQDHCYAAAQVCWEDLTACQSAQQRAICLDSLWKCVLAWNVSAERARIIRNGRTGRRKPGSPPRPATAKPGDNPAGQVPEEPVSGPGWDPATGLPVG